MENIRKKYLIVGTGPSVKEVQNFDYSSLPEDVIIVSVNTSILFLNYANLWFSIDSSPRNLTASETALKRNIPVVWCLENHNKVNTNHSNVFKFEKKYSTRVLYKNPNTPEDWMIRWGCVEGFSDVPPIIHTGNSLYSALNLVYFDRPEKIAILGLDGSSKASVGGNHIPNNLSHLNPLFRSSLPQLKANDIKVLNGSENSAVTCFDRSTPVEALEWISS